MPRRSESRAGSAARKSGRSFGPKGPMAELFREAERETIRAVASVLDHESRNLLGALGTCVQILSRNAHLTEDDRELLDLIRSGSHRLNEIVSQFAMFADPGPVRPQSVDLHGLIDETLNRLERDDRYSSDLIVSRDFDFAVGEVWGDREQLGQAFWHLFLNAVQAMGDEGRLEVETRRENARVEISVRDTGPGIPAAVRPRIFEPLFTTRSRGTGLGLSIVRQIVEGHGGEVRVLESRETGSVFRVMLPVERNEV